MDWALVSTVIIILAGEKIDTNRNRRIDVVLNSLAGEALRLSWHCLAKFGRFLEIGG